MVNRKVAVGFATWRERIFGGGDDPMAKAMGTSSTASSRAAGCAGTRCTRSRSARWSRCVRSMGHFLNRELSRGWGAWSEMAADRKAFMQKLRRGLSRMVNRKLAVAYLMGGVCRAAW